jgi:uncharacterized protein (DUF1697 family)
VALLRGVNVGGRNAVAMADLRSAFEGAGYSAVSTYIQSGNVLFTSDAPRATMEDRLESLLGRRFGLPLVVVVRSYRQLRDIVGKAPDGFGTQPEIFHSDVIFLKHPLSARRTMQAIDCRDGVDRAWPGSGVVYISRLSARLTQSRLNRVAATPEYQRMTIRSWATTTKLLNLLDQAAP